MEAKNTVMTGKEIDKVVNTFSQIAGYNDVRTLEQVVADAQARISFKAGMQKVVEWVEKNHWNSELGRVMHIDILGWQSFLKENGLIRQ